MRALFAVAAASSLVVAVALQGCGSEASTTSSDDGGGAGSSGSSGSSGSTANDPACPASQPTNGAACTLDAKKHCGYGCNATASCVDGKWSLVYTDQVCAPDDAGGPITCGTQTCSGNQYCLTPCCGGAAPQCEPVPDSGACPVGTSLSQCPGEPDGKGCRPDPCKPPPPTCVDSPTDPKATSCAVEKGTRYLTCVCA